MKTFILRHEHRYGTTVYPYRSEKDLTGFYNEDSPAEDETLQLFNKITDDVGIEFDRGETIEVTELDLNNIPTF